MTSLWQDLGTRCGLLDKSRTSPDGLPERYLYSPDMRYRYAFARWWGSVDLARCAAWVLLNPATGDTEQRRRPTLERCITWSRAWGYDGLVVVNLFAHRVTKPAALGHVDDPVGPCNDEALALFTDACSLTVAAWGWQGSLRGRSATVRSTLAAPMCLGTTKKGEPLHPLYLSSATKLVPLLTPGAGRPQVPVFRGGTGPVRGVDLTSNSALHATTASRRSVMTDALGSASGQARVVPDVGVGRRASRIDAFSSWTLRS